MSADEHRVEAERLLTEAKTASTRLTASGPLPVGDMQATQKTIDQAIAMAHVHALLASR